MEESRRNSIKGLRDAAGHCRDCPLWKNATQTVFGEGSPRAEVMLIGEQPGDQEDQKGRPFVGPAGKLLDKALQAAGIDRREVYLTNAVKHFKHELRGKRRMHKTPAQKEIEACLQWLEAELRVIKPRVIVCLGATAAKVLLGKAFRITKQRGKLIPSERAEFVFATAHPSSILRAPDERSRHEAFDALVKDLKIIPRVLGRETQLAKAA